MAPYIQLRNITMVPAWILHKIHRGVEVVYRVTSEYLLDGPCAGRSTFGANTNDEFMELKTTAASRCSSVEESSSFSTLTTERSGAPSPLGPSQEKSTSHLSTTRKQILNALPNITCFPQSDVEDSDCEGMEDEEENETSSESVLLALIEEYDLAPQSSSRNQTPRRRHINHETTPASMKCVGFRQGTGEPIWVPVKDRIKEVIPSQYVDSMVNQAEAREMEEYQAYVTEKVTSALKQMFETGEIWHFVNAEIEAGNTNRTCELKSGKMTGRDHSASFFLPRI